MGSTWQDTVAADEVDSHVMIKSQIMSKLFALQHSQIAPGTADPCGTYYIKVCCNSAWILHTPFTTGHNLLCNVSLLLKGRQ